MVFGSTSLVLGVEVGHLDLGTQNDHPKMGIPLYRAHIFGGPHFGVVILGTKVEMTNLHTEGVRTKYHMLVGEATECGGYWVGQPLRARALGVRDSIRDHKI